MIERLRVAVEKNMRERLERVERVRVLELKALGPEGMNAIIEWARSGRVMENVLLELMECRSRMVQEKALIAMQAQKEAVRMLMQLYKALEGENNERED